MVDENIVHHIQKHILSVLYRRKNARFRDLRQRNVDTNLFAYHLKLLLKNNFVKKTDEGYSLDDEGLRYVDRISEADMKVRKQPKIITMLVLQNSKGEVFLQKRLKQPYIDLWTLPHGKLHIEDNSIKEAVSREASEKISLNNVEPVHAGDCYIRVMSGGKPITSTFVHIFKGESDNVEQTDDQIWAKPSELSKHTLAPAVQEIIAKTLSDDMCFFEEFSEEIGRFG